MLLQNGEDGLFVLATGRGVGPASELHHGAVRVRP